MIEMPSFPRSMPILTTLMLTLAACEQPLDMDMRGLFGNAPSTADAARNATTNRPAPDARGIISYPGYQVAVAERGDTLATLARRIGADPQELARFNGIQTGDPLRQGEVIALPGRVAEPTGGPIQPPGGVDITTLADGAIRRADEQQVQTTTLAPAAQVGVEPVRHKVERGETAFSIARLYDVSIRSLADWNGLGADFAVREGQYLLIPVAMPGENTDPFDATEIAAVTAPGAGSPTPTPPSASKPLPPEDTTPAAAPVETTAAPDLSASETTRTGARMAFPVTGDIIRDYAKGRNDGIDIAAAPGTAVNAADDGVVAAITEDTNGIPIIVVKHSGNILTVYSNVGGLAVAKGDNVRRGQKLAEIRREGTAALHFEVRDGFDSVDPMTYLNPS
ncbi:Murein DD-endopeptidase MepM and murein hydrolase activator NlpD, contain LysM domain [Roseovarius azorensis]|uniref:Murein DD-endopeptidase MepM and murein hydrolase activator NlpD, contain LysM domain n=1 Tax=Roseovarius azorensis TaxID=1287727 RepID=A0A1H7VK07_9RHOB|nr:LysM peptidoglycan-binding domain-containing M23 family metallopeptidase [Roseovarius azorensis]SEM09229.1 Murein DD-endopeptidase MepM and murein hydrolase activator NlpD, contain LysM domain [Roseovarius azorensis]